MKKFNVTVRRIVGYHASDSFEIPVYVEELTDLMQMRLVTKNINMRNVGIFECGVDFHEGLWITTSGIYGFSIYEFIKHYFERVYDGNFRDIECIRICDDHIYEDRDNERVYDGEIAPKHVDVVDVENIGD